MIRTDGLSTAEASACLRLCAHRHRMSRISGMKVQRKRALLGDHRRSTLGHAAKNLGGTTAPIFRVLEDPIVGDRKRERSSKEVQSGWKCVLCVQKCIRTDGAPWSEPHIFHTHFKSSVLTSLNKSGLNFKEMSCPSLWKRSAKDLRERKITG